MVSLLKEAMISTLTHLQGQEVAVEVLLVRLLKHRVSEIV